ncbi:sigma-70 family RNA polymerase sigma factor [Brevibacterium moorei]|uniref:sigma-70 family RNA polymerase sigma factor n=1 Tax=Brevibacterium moorei TaxID=2968457 RepID=UPI00211BB118|nr:sigma-70 family RNA polymerase sigma factor [Brevibacterium sp. 68QC2CO]MCQ9385737.1 sigma-70 family RNA polymerase sigma factor [Brevibacterium sp. 68QC2CO]
MSEALISRPASSSGGELETNTDPFVRSLQLRSPRISNPHLWEWQVEALTNWYAAGCRGVVEAVTGAGKTMIGITAAFEAFKAGIRTLVIVPTAELQIQWQERLATTIPEARVGTLGNGRHDSLDSCDVLVAIINSAARHELLSAHQSGMLIADECHRYGAPSFVKALSERFHYRLGLTATYTRSDDAQKFTLDPYFGGVVFRLWYDRALRDGVISPFKIAFVGVQLTSGERSVYEDTTSRITKLGAGLKARLKLDHASANRFFTAIHRLASREHDQSPNCIMARKYLEAVSRRQQLLAGARGKQALLSQLSTVVTSSNGTLLFSETIGTSDVSANVLRGCGILTEVVSSVATPVERRKALQSFGASRVKALCAPRVLDEGIDVPAADLAIIVSGSKQARQSIQRLGRVIRRKADGGCGRLVLLYAANTVEDPTVRTAHPLIGILPWAHRHAVFTERQVHDLRRFLKQEFIQSAQPAAGGRGEANRQPKDAAAEAGEVIEPSAPARSSKIVLREEPDEDDLPSSNDRSRCDEHIGEQAFDGDLLKFYLAQVGETPLLTADEEVELSKRIEAGLFARHLLQTENIRTRRRGLDLEWAVAEGADAYNLFLRSNLRLVVSIAKRYLHAGHKLDLLDLIQEGNSGLVRAVQKFDYTQGNKFSTYASWWIRQAVSRAIADLGRTVRLPVHMSDQVSVARACRNRDSCKEHDHVKVDLVERVQPISLDDILEHSIPYGPLDEWVSLADRIIIDEVYVVPDPAEIVVAESVRVWNARKFDEILSYLPERDRYIILGRAGCLTGEKMVLEELGKIFGVTRERIRQLENKAMKALRAYFIDGDSEPLKAYASGVQRLPRKTKSAIWIADPGRKLPLK